MIRNLKAFGLALVAMLALGAVVASGASAQTRGHLTTEGEKEVTLDITELPGKTNGLVSALGGGIVECPNSIITGHKTKTEEQTPGHELIKHGETTATLTPHYKNCKTLFTNAEEEIVETHETTVTMNGCDYHLYILETIPTTSNYGVEADLECPPDKDVEIHVYPFANSELGGSACTITVEEQTGLTGPVLKNNSSGEKHDLVVEGEITGIHSSQSGFGCEEATSTEDVLKINVTVEGTDKDGNPLGITVSDE